MFKFLLVMFAFFPDGTIGVAKKPMASLEQCQDVAGKLAGEAKAKGVSVIGTCVQPKDFVGE